MKPAFRTSFACAVLACGGTGCSSKAAETMASHDAGRDGAIRTLDASIDRPIPHDAQIGNSDTGHPGDAALRNDGGCSGSVALTYNAATDRAPHMATPPTIPPAGQTYKDPTYGTTVSRVTDATTTSGNVSFRVANEFWGNDWNTTGTLFYLQDSAGALLPYAFDTTSLVATPVPDTATPGTSLKMPLASGGFSRTDPNVLYGFKATTIAQFDFSTQTTTDIVALTTIVPGVTGNALGVQQGQNGLLATVFGGPEQDKMPYIATWDPSTMMGHVVDITTSTLDGKAIGASIGGGIHGFKMDVTGQYLAFSVTNGSSADWVWDTSSGTVTSILSLDTVGAAAWASKANQSYAWNFQTFAAPTTSTPLITPPAPVDSMASASLDWKNATGGALAPLIVETMRQPSDTSPWHAWDEEILAVRTDGKLIPGDGGSETEVWRFAHTWNTYSPDASTFSDNYYYLYIPRVSQNGWFVLFDSNWNASLGTDSSGQPRTDAFIVALPNPCGP